MSAASASSTAIAAICSLRDGQFAAASSSNSNSGRKAAFFPVRALLGGCRLSSSFSSPNGVTCKFGSVLSVSTRRGRSTGTQIRALDPDFYKIPYVEGIPVGKRLKLWNIPPNCDHGELREWLDSIPDVNVEALEFTDDPELNAQGVGGFVEFGTKQEACMAIVRLDGRKFKGTCIRMDFVEKRPHEREIGGRRNRPSRNYARDRGYSQGSYSGGSYAGSGYAGSGYAGSGSGYAGSGSGYAGSGSGYAGSGSGGATYGTPNVATAASGSSMGSYGAPSIATATPSGSTFHASTSPVAPNWSAPPPPPPPPPPRAYGPAAHRIFVGNLSWNMDDHSLISLFRNHGNVLEARIMRDRETGNSRGFGFVAMSTADEMNAAIAALDGTVADGRPLKVSVASR